jgi:hypothetical protein
VTPGLEENLCGDPRRIDYQERGFYRLYMIDATLTLDPRATIDRLKSGEIEGRQARTHVEAHNLALRHGIMTKAGLGESRAKTMGTARLFN